jgi:uncharacterized protein (DUF885 family)
LWNEKGSLTDQYVYLLMAQQPFRDEADVVDYLDRLTAIGTQIDQMIAYLQKRQEQGIQIPYLLYAEVMEEMGAQDWEVGWKTPFITVLAVRLQNLEELSHEERESYYERGGQIVDEVILPAFGRLMVVLYGMAGNTSEAIGLSAQPHGAEAHQTLLDRTTTLDLPAADLYAFGETRVAALGDTVRLAAAEAGYDAALPLQEIFRQAKVDRDYALGLDIFVTLRNLKLDAELHMNTAFETSIDNDLVMVPVFDEGWVLYADYLAWEMGLYEDDPNANLGWLQSELTAAARMVVDVGIHTMGWDAQEAARYLVANAGIDRAEANEMVLQQIAQPAEAVAGYIGYDFICNLRNAAQSRLGDEFDIKAFHTAVLSNGSLPLPLLEEQVWNALEWDEAVGVEIIQ